MVRIIPRDTLLHAVYIILEASSYYDRIHSELINLALLINESLLRDATIK